MRLCRFRYQSTIAGGFYSEDGIVAIATAAEAWEKARCQRLDMGSGEQLLDYLPGGVHFDAARDLHAFVRSGGVPAVDMLTPQDVQLLVPIPRPNKLLLLAGNYARHIEEGGGQAAERRETFPYVFMKPPSTTLTDPGQPVLLPQISPNHIDWELELAVVIGRLARHVREADALNYVAGYTIVNDISDRKFRPNPSRTLREKDSFFDWLHGKWHDSFCPCGPCIASADSIPDPQSLPLQLRVNGKLHQNSTTAAQVFPVAAIIEFISSFVTLEPGDIISTGTPHGVGNASGTWLRSGDRIEASIGSIGVLTTPVQ